MSSQAFNKSQSLGKCPYYIVDFGNWELVKMWDVDSVITLETADGVDVNG